MQGPPLQALCIWGLFSLHSSSGRSTSVWVKESSTLHFSWRVCLPGPQVALQRDHGPGMNLHRAQKKTVSHHIGIQLNVYDKFLLNGTVNLTHTRTERQDVEVSAL